MTDRSAEDFWARNRLTIEDALDYACNAVAHANPPDPVAAIGRQLLRPTAPQPSAPTAPPPPADSAESWTAAKWLDARGLSQIVAAQLIPLDDPDQLAALRRLASSADLRSALRERLSVDALADALVPALHELVAGDVVTAEQMQGKFLSDGVGLLEYRGLSTFFGGLEAIVGAPHPRVHGAMALEHTAEGCDRHTQFTTENYGVTTTSALEFKFVAEPDSQVEWPVEGKLVIDVDQGVHADQQRWDGVHVVASERQKKRRQPMPLAELKLRVAERGLQLQKLDEPPLTLEEAIGARLYTGPMFVKYNTVLRALGSRVLVLRGKLVQLCCAEEDAAAYDAAVKEAKVCHPRRCVVLADEKARQASQDAAFDEAAKRANKYTTTLHAINSAVVKLSKLTVASTVYRGVHDLVLPEPFWKPNEYGVRGGVEGAFCSTTLDRETALKYAAGTGGTGFVFEIQQGMIDRGADITFLSQYPFEREILFAPLTGLEVQGSRVEGSVLVVEVKLSVNLTSLTIEQVIGKRRKMLADMVPGLEAELRQGLEKEGVATSEGVDGLVALLRPALEADALSHDAEWYNDDEKLSAALGTMLRAKRQLEEGGVQRVAELSKMPPSPVRRWGFAPEAHTSKAAAVLARLDDAKGGVRKAAVETLGELSPQVLATHSGAVLARFEDVEEHVRRAAVSTLGKLLPEVLATHAGAVVARLEHADGGVRCAVLETLGKLPPDVLAMHAEAVVNRLEDEEGRVRGAAVEALGNLSPEALATHAGAVIARLEHAKKGVRSAAVSTLGKLSPEALATHAGAVIARLEHADGGVRFGAVLTLSKLSPEMLATHAGAVIARLEDKVKDVRVEAVSTLGKLSPEALATHTGAVIGRLEDEGPVRLAAVETLCRLPPEVLAAHAGAVLARLEDTEGSVRSAAVSTLGKLSPETLAAHAGAVIARLEDEKWYVRRAAVETLGKLPPAVLATHAAAVLARLEDPDSKVRYAAVSTLDKVPSEVCTPALSALRVCAHDGLHVHPDGQTCTSRDDTWCYGRIDVPFTVPSTEVVHFEVHVMTSGCLMRLGWEEKESQRIGHSPLSFGYGSTGKKSSGGDFSEYGVRFANGDTIGCTLDTSHKVIRYSKNGLDLGEAFHLDAFLPLQEPKVLYPAIGVKQGTVRVNPFQARHVPKYPVQALGQLTLSKSMIHDA